MAEILAKRQYIFLAHAAEHIIKLKYKKKPLKTSAIYDNICDISVISHFGLIFVLVGRIHLQITHVHEDLASVFLTNKRARKLHSNKYVDFTFKNFNNKAALAAVINAYFFT